MNSIKEAYDSALSLFEKGELQDALEILLNLDHRFPGDPQILSLIGACHFNAGRKSQAAASWQKAASLAPDDAEIHFNLGQALHDSANFSEAHTALQRALALNSGSARAWHISGLVLKQLGQLDDAERAFHQALTISPDFLDATQDLGILYLDAHRLDEAEAMFRRAVASRPHQAETSYNLGLVLLNKRRFEESIPLFRNALTSRPDFAEANNNLGLALYELDRLGESEDAFRCAIRSRFDLPQAHVNLAHVLHRTDRLDEAVISAQHALRLKPDYSDAFYALGKALEASNSGDLSQALAALRSAVACEPGAVTAHVNLLHSLTFVTDNGYEILKACKQFSDRIEAPYRNRAVQYGNDPSPAKRLKVGYVSPDFRGHCQSLFMLPLLSNHDHQACEIFCYSSVKLPDAKTESIKALADVWRDVSDLDDETLAQCIMADRIDVLVDLTMHMSNGRPLLFARRPAPVQVAWLAYPGTTGSSAIGYRLTDPWLDPVDVSGADDRYTERSIRLPRTFWCYEPFDKSLMVSELSSDASSCITFGCLNSPQKLTIRTFELWAQVLKKVPDSRMILLVVEGRAREEVNRRFDALGIDPSRLTYVGYQSYDAYMRTYQRIDIALDTFPYNGHTTSLDSFWMGVPVVTCIGAGPASRAGYSLCMNLGLSELVAGSDEAFVETAVALAHDRDRLRALRAGLRQRMEQSPLMEGAAFARGMEAAYRQMWTEWCETRALQ
jgi:protein O-GlcNAc transferase